MRSMEILDQKHIQNEYNPNFHKPESLSTPKLFLLYSVPKVNEYNILYCHLKKYKM